MTAHQRPAAVMQLLLVGVSFLAGLGVAGWMFHDGKPHRRPIASAASAPDRGGPEARETESKSGSGEQVMPSPPQPAYIARLRALSELNDALDRKLSIKTMDAFGHINPDFAVLFGLSKSQVARLNQEIRTARERLSEIEANHATAASADDGTFVISISPFPAEGGKVYDYFMNRVQDVLGPERWLFYNKLSSADFSRSSELGMFGLNETKIHVKPIRNNQGTMSWTSGIRSEDGVMVKKVDMHPKLLQIHYPLIHRKMIASRLLPDHK